MKRLLIIMSSLFSLAASACPDLSGHYECKDFDNGAVQDVTITQALNANVWSYQIKIVSNGETKMRNYVADGLAKPSDRPEWTTRTERSFCDGNALKVEVKGVSKANENLDAMITINLDAQKNLYDNYIGKQGNKDLKFEETCQRK